MKYDTFISYSHDADGRLAPAVQSGLQHLAKPWYRRRALRVFRDETGLAVDPHMWESITGAMDESKYFVLLASPEAAGSPSVNREIKHWLSSQPAESILLVVTGGALKWSDALGDYDAARSTALPPALLGAYTAEPRHLDLQWAHDEEQLDPRHSRFRAALATLAAAIHGVAPEDLEGEDVRLHRRAVRLAATAAIVLVALTVGALIATGLAVSYAATANANEQTALANAEEARLQRGHALLNAERASRQRRAAETNARRAAQSQSEAQRQEARARASAAEAQRNADEAQQNATAAASNSALAHANAERAAANAAEARKNAGAALVAAQSAEQNAAQARAEQERADNNAQEAQTNAAVALSRQLAANSQNNVDTQYDLALLQAVAANSISPTVEAEGSLLRAVTSHPELRLQYRPHQGRATSAWVSPSGDTIAAALSTGGIELWNAGTGKLSASVRTATDGSNGPMVQSAAFGPEHQLAVLWTGSQGTWLEIIDTQLGFPVMYIPATSLSPVGSIAFAPDGKTIAFEAWRYPDPSGPLLTVIELWDLTVVPQFVEEIPLDNFVSAITFSPDGQALAWAVTVGDLFEGRPGVFVRHISDHTTVGPAVVDEAQDPLGPVSPFALAFSPTGDSILAVSNGSATPLDFIDAATGTLSRSRSLEAGKAVAASQDQRLVAVDTDDGNVAFQEPATGRVVGRAVQHRPGPFAFGRVPQAFSPDARQFLAVREDGSIRTFDVEPGPVRFGRHAPVTTYPGEESTLSPDGKLALLQGGTIVEVHTGRVIHVLDEFIDVTTATFSSDSHFLAFNNDMGPLNVLDLETGFVRQRALSGQDEEALDFAFRPDGHTIAVLTRDYFIGQRLRYWDYRTGTTPTTEPPFQPHPLFGIEDLTFGPDGTLVTLSGQDLGADNPRLEIRRPGRPTLTVAGQWTSLMVSPDGAVLAALRQPITPFEADRGTVDLFRIADGSRIGISIAPRKDGSTLTSVAFDRDSRKLAMGTSDGTIQMWDVRSTAPVGPALEGHTRGVNAVAFRDDGRLVSTASTPFFNPGTGRGEVIIWPVDAPSLVLSACERANREMTQLEWTQFVGNALPFRPICRQPQPVPPPPPNPPVLIPPIELAPPVVVTSPSQPSQASPGG